MIKVLKVPVVHRELFFGKLLGRIDIDGCCSRLLHGAIRRIFTLTLRFCVLG
jgi:hypothetical protein